VRNLPPPVVHIICLCGFRPPARYALMRLPENLASFPLSRALMALVTATTNREHAKIYEQAETLHVLVSQPDFSDQDLAPIVQALLLVFLGIHIYS
jgi:COP9 signalosome complex subunit 8